MRSIHEIITEKAVAGSVPIQFALHRNDNWQTTNWIFDPALKAIRFSDQSVILVRPYVPPQPEVEQEQEQRQDHKLSPEQERQLSQEELLGKDFDAAMKK